MRRSAWTGLGIAAGAALLVSTTVMPADAGTTLRRYTCSAGGFRGTFYVNDSLRNPRLYYKIDKGSQQGGNKANVNLRDNGVAPTHVKTLDTAIQDGKIHGYDHYARGMGGMDITFIFDKSWARDPRCGTGGTV